MAKNHISQIAFPQVVMVRQLKASDHSHIYLVRNKATGKRYIYRCFAGSGEVYRKLMDVHCPYLPDILDVKEENGEVYVLEEYIQGDTLAFLLETNPLPPSFAKQIITQICHALTVLHGIGAVHRDIKPENIMLRGSDAVLIDFDASRLFKADSTTDTRVMGTTGYAAPEQYGFSQTDARTDIYALGILLNEMLTGQHPSKQLAEGEYRPIIEKCTRINADQRYASVAQLLTALNTPRRGKQAGAWAWLAVPLVFILLLAGMLRIAVRRKVRQTQHPRKPPLPGKKPRYRPNRRFFRHQLRKKNRRARSSASISGKATLWDMPLHSTMIWTVTEYGKNTSSVRTFSPRPRKVLFTEIPAPSSPERITSGIFTPVSGA